MKTLTFLMLIVVALEHEHSISEADPNVATLTVINN